MRCELVSNYVVEHGYSRGAAYVLTHCRTHNWDFGSSVVAIDALCPLGRIEQATDAALAAIREEHLRATDNPPPLPPPTS